MMSKSNAENTARAVYVLLEDYQPYPFEIVSVYMAFDLYPRRTVVDCTMKVKRKAGASDKVMRLNGIDLQLVSIVVDGDQVPLNQIMSWDEAITIPVPSKSEFEVKTTVIVDPTANTVLEGLYFGDGLFSTQCESEGFRRITYYPDRPDVLSRFTVRMEANKADYPTLLSNGNRLEQGPAENPERHYALWHDPFAKPAYLFALVAGNLAVVEDEFITMSGKKVALKIFVEQGKENRTQFAMQALKRSMLWDEQRFGREYDLDTFMIVAVPSFNMGAMENKGLNIFNDRLLLADPLTATDEQYDRIDGVIAHEYFHNWTGNRITCRDWFQLCVKEGLTVFRDQEYTSDTQSRNVKRIEDAELMVDRQFEEDNGPLAHPVRPDKYQRIDNFYTRTVYEKGAEVIRMLECIVGRNDFDKGMQIYFERHDGEAITVEQFIKCFEDATGQSLAQFFLWYEQAGTPRVSVSRHYDEKSKTLRLDFTQKISDTLGQKNKKPMVIPIDLAGFNSNGDRADLETEDKEALNGSVFLLDEATKSITFKGVSEKLPMSFLRGFSAPVILQDDLSDQERLAILFHEQDGYAKYSAAKSLKMKWIMQVATTLASGESKQLPVDKPLIAALTQTLKTADMDPALTAYLLSFPNPGTVAQFIAKDVVPEIVGTAVNHCVTTTGQHMNDELLRVLEWTSRNDPMDFNHQQRSLRKLNTKVARLLGATGEDEAFLLIEKNYRTAQNLTQLYESLATIVHYFPTKRETFIADFEKRYFDTPLVLDNWFSLLAGVNEMSVIDRVRTLLKHPGFSLQVPNRVYGLLGGFVSNFCQFHRQDGQGHNFVLDVMKQLESINPRVSSRFSRSFQQVLVLNRAQQQQSHDMLLQFIKDVEPSAETLEVLGNIISALEEVL